MVLKNHTCSQQHFHAYKANYLLFQLKRALWLCLLNNNGFRNLSTFSTGVTGVRIEVANYIMGFLLTFFINLRIPINMKYLLIFYFLLLYIIC